MLRLRFGGPPLGVTGGVAGTVAGVLKRRWPLILLVGWTAFIWLTRIKNAWSASDETTGAKVVSTVTAVLLLVAAVAVARVLVVARRRALTAVEGRLVMILGAGTIVVWAVRIPQILLGDEGVPFKVVHAVLGGISIALALLSMRVARVDEAGSGARVVSPVANAGR